MFEKYNAHSRRHNDIVYLSLCRVQTDVSREQEIQFIILFFDLLLINEKCGVGKSLLFS